MYDRKFHLLEDTLERESFEEEKLHELVEKWDFTEKTFVDCLLVPLTVHEAFEHSRRKRSVTSTKQRNS